MKKYLAWIPALVIMTAIFWFSAQPADMSTEMSDSVTRALLWTDRKSTRLNSSH